MFAVREPFSSRTSGVNVVFGVCEAKTPLRLTSLMAEGGVIFSDGVEADHITSELAAWLLCNPLQESARWCLP